MNRDTCAHFVPLTQSCVTCDEEFQSELYADLKAYRELAMEAFVLVETAKFDKLEDLNWRVKWLKKYDELEKRRKK